MNRLVADYTLGLEDRYGNPIKFPLGKNKDFKLNINTKSGILGEIYGKQIKMFNSIPEEQIDTVNYIFNVAQDFYELELALNVFGKCLKLDTLL